MLEVLRFVYSSFWIWLGTVFMLAMFLNAVTFCWSRLLRYLSVVRAGWPPSHLDADGDWRVENNEVKDLVDSSDTGEGFHGNG